jgi:hypothetical protein
MRGSQRLYRRDELPVVELAQRLDSSHGGQGEGKCESIELGYREG